MPHHNLSDIELILLATANQRNDGSLMPPAASISNSVEKIAAAVAKLITFGLVGEQPARDKLRIWRDDDGQRIGVFITDAGKAIIAGEGKDEDTTPLDPADGKIIAASESNQVEPARAGSKQALLLQLLMRENGATMDDLTGVLGWLPHTKRAAITGLRKKGHAVQNQRTDGASRYRIIGAA